MYCHISQSSEKHHVIPVKPIKPKRLFQTVSRNANQCIMLCLLPECNPEKMYCNISCIFYASLLKNIMSSP